MGLISRVSSRTYRSAEKMSTTDSYHNWIAQKSAAHGNPDIIVKTMSQRKSCWFNRDKYYKCFDEANKNDFPTIFSRLEHCSKEVEDMYSTCPISWSENFMKKYIQTKLGVRNTRPNTIVPQKPVDEEQRMADMAAAKQEFKNYKK